MAITILLLQESLFVLDISVAQQVLSLPLATGRVKNYGLGQGVLPRVPQNLDKENISIFVE